MCFGYPNIVEVLDFNVLPSGAPYLVLELLAGENLAARLARGPLAVAEALALARQIGSALAAAHKSGVVHRDLKPENVFLCPPTDEDATVARVKVLDFGISKIAGSTTLQTQEQRVMGTPQYMAPEQAKGQNKQVDQRSDVFALGAIVYEMLAGKPAFQGENLAEVVFKVVYEKPEPLTTMAPDAPPAVVAAIERALAKEPAERWPDVGAFIEALTGRPLAATVDRGSRISTPPPRASLGSPGAKTPPGASQGGGGAKTPSGGGAGGAASGPGAFAETLISGDHAGPLVGKAPTPQGAAGAGSGTPRADAHAATMASVGPGAAVAPVPAPRTPPETSSAPATKKRVGTITTVVGIAVVGGAIGLWASQRGASGGGGGATAGGGVATTDAGAGPVAVTPAAADAAPAADAAAVVAVTPADAGAVVIAAGRADAGSKKPPPPSPSPSPSPTGGGDDDPGGGDDEPPKARELLDQATAALGAGEYKDAIRLAMRSLNEKRLPRAYVVIAKAYCHMGDLGNAKAQLPNLPARLRVGVVRYCKKVGVDLGG